MAWGRQALPVAELRATDYTSDGTPRTANGFLHMVRQQEKAMPAVCVGRDRARIQHLAQVAHARRARLAQQLVSEFVAVQRAVVRKRLHLRAAAASTSSPFAGSVASSCTTDTHPRTRTNTCTDTHADTHAHTACSAIAAWETHTRAPSLLWAANASSVEARALLQYCTRKLRIRTRGAHARAHTHAHAHARAHTHDGAHVAAGNVGGVGKDADVDVDVDVDVEVDVEVDVGVLAYAALASLPATTARADR